MKHLEEIPDWRDIFTSVQFLSRLPVPEKLTNHDSGEFRDKVWAFPLAGGVISVPGITAATLFYLLGLPPLIIAAIIVAVDVAVAGALHEDGLADVADGFGGGKNAVRKLEIMKDSRLGAFGGAALILVLIMRAALLTSLLSLSLCAAICGILAAQFTARCAKIAIWNRLPPASLAGLANSIGQPSDATLIKTLVCGLPLAIVFGLLATGLAQTLVAFLITGVVLWGFAALSMKQIGGQTGDVLGATHQVAYVTFLIGLLTFSAG